MLERNFFGNDARFHHIGLAVFSIEELLGEDIEIVSDTIQNVSVAFLSFSGINIEVIEPLGEDSPVSSSLRKGNKLLHLCFCVPDLKAAISEARKHGFHCISQPVSATALDNKNIVWLFSRAYGLIELLED